MSEVLRSVKYLTIQIILGSINVIVLFLEGLWIYYMNKNEIIEEKETHEDAMNASDRKMLGEMPVAVSDVVVEMEAV